MSALDEEVSGYVASALDEEEIRCPFVRGVSEPVTHLKTRTRATETAIGAYAGV